MTGMIHRIVTWGLVLSLALTGVSAAVARGQSPAVGWVEICHGLTTVSIAVDATGQPAAPVHLCPDGALALFGAERGEAPALGVLARAWAHMPATPYVKDAVEAPLPRLRARGPPAFL